MGTSGRSCAGTAWVFARNAILIVFLTVLLMELALRALGFSRAVLYEPDSLVGWSGRPGAQGVYLDEGSAEVQISSAGVRDREHSIVKPANVWRVAVLGDSFTDALQVAEDKRFTSVIERLLARCDAGDGRLGFFQGRSGCVLRPRYVALQASRCSGSGGEAGATSEVGRARAVGWSLRSAAHAGVAASMEHRRETDRGDEELDGTKRDAVPAGHAIERNSSRSGRETFLRGG